MNFSSLFRENKSLFYSNTLTLEFVNFIFYLERELEFLKLQV